MVTNSTRSEFIGAHCVVDERGCGPSVWASLREFLRRHAGASEWVRSVRFLCIGSEGQMFLETICTDANFESIAEVLQRWLNVPGAAMGVSGLEFVRFGEVADAARVKCEVSCGAAGPSLGTVRPIDTGSQQGFVVARPAGHQDRSPVMRAV